MCVRGNATEASSTNDEVGPMPNHIDKNFELKEVKTYKKGSLRSSKINNKRKDSLKSTTKTGGSL